MQLAGVPFLPSISTRHRRQEPKLCRLSVEHSLGIEPPANDAARITDVPAGTYTLRIRLNNPPAGSATPIINERDYSNNVAEIQVDIPPA